MAGIRWLEQTLACPGRDGNATLAAHAAATRYLGTSPVVLTPAERGALGFAPYLSRWWCDELGRVVLLLDMATRESEGAMASNLPAVPGVPRVIDDAYRHGDVREQQAVLRALPLLPGPERFVRLATEACRTNILPVFEAIACENRYPAAFFPAHTFDQMVLEALSLGVALGRIVGLPQRVGPALQRMAADYASEQRAAGLSVPADIERFITRRDPSRTTAQPPVDWSRPRPAFR